MPSCTLGSSVVACIYRAAGKSLSLEGMSHTAIATGVQTFCSPEAEANYSKRMDERAWFLERSASVKTLQPSTHHT